MDKKDAKRFAMAFGSMCTVFDKEISPVLNKAYFETLKAFDIAQVETAISKAISTLKWFPKPIELVEMITGGQKQIENLGLVAAHKIVSHLQAYGSRVYPNLDDDPIAQHLMARRWPYLRWSSNVLESELKWWVKEFSEAYNAYSATEAPLTIEAPKEVKKLVDSIGKEAPE